MDNTIEIGTNRTGLDMAPLSKQTLVEFAWQQGSRGAPAQEGALAEERRLYGLEADAVGTVPPPARLKGMATTAMEALKGNRPQVLIDKLGERLAYDVAQALQSILFIELGDNASWELLIDLARQSGHDKMADLFTAPLATKQHHLQLVQGWLKQAVLSDAR